MNRGVLALVLAIVACGGSAKHTKPLEATVPGGPPDCTAVAAHLTDAAFTWQPGPKASRQAVAQLLAKHCDADRWSAEARQCMAKVTDQDSSDACLEMLTADQRKKVGEATVALDASVETEAPASAPAPERSADPCEGGE